MSYEAFDAVLRKAGFMGRPHGSRVAMGTAISKLSKDSEHDAFYKALGAVMRQELKSGLSVGEKAGVALTKADNTEKKAFVESVPETELKELAFMALESLGIKLPESTSKGKSGKK
tara:strand:- start:2154 stop:2501 length:348 start_codon:yes stop_codon:yes gene_type:complete